MRNRLLACQAVRRNCSPRLSSHCRHLHKERQRKESRPLPARRSAWTLGIPRRLYRAAFEFELSFFSCTGPNASRLQIAHNEEAAYSTNFNPPREQKLRHTFCVNLIVNIGVNTKENRPFKASEGGAVLKVRQQKRRLNPLQRRARAARNPSNV